MDKDLLEKIKILRELTGAPIGKCKEAIEKEGGDLEKAKNYLRKIGEGLLEKKKEAKAGQGIIEGYIHFNGRVAALVEVRSETDFVAKSLEFKKLAHTLAVQVATMNPLYVSLETVPEDVIRSKREEFSQDLGGKPEKIKEEIINGKLKKWAEDNCLLDQVYFKDENLKVKDLVNEYANKFGEKIEIRRFTRLSVDD